MGGKIKKPVLYQHTNSSTHLPVPIPITKPTQSSLLNHLPMEVNEIIIKTDCNNPFPAVRSICVHNDLCFRCLQSFDPKTHVLSGERHFPNKNATLSEKLGLISNTQNKK